MHEHTFDFENSDHIFSDGFTGTGNVAGYACWIFLFENALFDLFLRHARTFLPDSICSVECVYYDVWLCV